MTTKKTLLPLGITVCILAAVFVFMPGGIKGKMLSSDITEKTLTVHSMAGQFKAWGGTVTGTDINCGVNGTSCTKTYMRGSGVALTATPMPGWKFDSWAVGSSEECHNWRATTQSSQCTTTITDDLDITAYFVLDNPLYDSKTLNVWISGGPTGGGKVTGGGISCGEYICMKTYDYGTSVTLTAEPNQGYKFDGWKDYSTTDRSICSGTGTCTLNMDSTIANNINVVAKFVPIPQPDPLILTIQKYSLHGTITGDGISCGSAQLSCTKTYTSTTSVALTAIPDVGYQFDGWGVECSGREGCSVLVNANKRVTANFSPAVFKTLTIQKPFDGMVTGTGISCGINGTDCTEIYPQRTVVTLTQIPSTNFEFKYWGGPAGCTGSGTCQITMVNDNTIYPHFALPATPNVQLNVVKIWNGTITGVGIDCGIDCEERHFSTDTNVTLTATPAQGQIFDGWSGACSGAGTCVVPIMNGNKTVYANFSSATKTLIIQKPWLGNIIGTGISCGVNGEDCTETYVSGTNVVLTAIATNSSYATYVWNGGGCSGNWPCSITMDSNKTVGANFFFTDSVLNVQTTGLGSVTGTGISCGMVNGAGGECSKIYARGSSVTLTAAPYAYPGDDYQFTGWTGACSGTGTCTVTMDTMNKSVTAVFIAYIYRTLNVGIIGQGFVSGADLSCDWNSTTGRGCAAIHRDGVTTSTITAIPRTGYKFDGWSGACSGAGACSVAMTSDKDITATFSLSSSGAVISTPSAPSAPRNLSVTAISGWATLQFTEPSPTGSSPITDYIIEYRGSSVFSRWITFKDGVWTQLSTTITGLSTGTYSFRVTAKNSVGKSVPSAIVTAGVVKAPRARVRI